MEVESHKETDRSFQLIFKNEQRRRELVPKILGLGRHIIGRISNCDFQIKSKKVSAIHAVLEITEKSVRIFDINSTNGVEVNGVKSIVSDLNIGDTVSFSGLEYTLESGELVVENLGELPEEKPLFPTKPLEGHPLNSLKNAEYSEYIFEDSEEIFPIFNYDLSSESVEVLVLHQDNVISIDYVGMKSEDIYFEGKEQSVSDNNVFFPYLTKKERRLILSNSNKDITVHSLDGFIMEKLSQRGIEKVESESLLLDRDDIVRISREGLEVYVRRAKSPPEVAAAPIMRRDAFFHKYVIPTVLAIIIPLFIISFLNLEVEEDKENKVERIATILYKKKLFGKKPAVSPKNVHGAVSMSNEKNPENKKGELGKGKVVKVAKKESVVTKKVEKKKSSTTKKSTQVEKSKKIVNNTKKKIRNSKIQAIPNLDFSSSLNQLLVSQKKLNASVTGGESSSTDSDESLSLDEGGQKKLKRIGLDGNESATEGIGSRVSQNVGADGLSNKKSNYIVGLNGNAVVRGSVNGSDVREKLRKHLFLFRSCVEKQLKPGDSKTDRVIFNFTIGASGFTPKVLLKTKVFNRSMTECMGNVVKGIQFTPPSDGTPANVTIPISFGR